jgi:nucleoside-diphosphate-sugar epimerase
VHRSDAARLARLAVEAAPAGCVVHAVGEEGVPFRAIAEAIGHGLGVPTASVAPTDALEHFGPMGLFAGLDCPATTVITEELLGWKATGPRLIEDLEQDYYFGSTSSPE